MEPPTLTVYSGIVYTVLPERSKPNPISFFYPMTMQLKKDSIRYIDQLRVIAAFDVVFVHIILGTFAGLKPLSSQWWLAHGVALTCQWPVPVFVMVSGVLLLDPSRWQESTATFYQKRLHRIGIPLIFWTGLCYVFMERIDHVNVTAGFILTNLLQARLPYHTHFLFIIAGLYLLTPLLRRFVQRATPLQRRSVIIFIFASSTFYALLNNIFWQNGRFLFTFFLPYTGYYLCGYEIPRIDPTRIKSKTLIAVIVLSALYIGVHTNTYIEFHGMQDSYFVLGFLSLPMIVLSIGIFWVLLLIDRQRSSSYSRIDRFFQRLAPATFGIYLMHVFILIGLRESLRGEVNDTPYLVNVCVGTLIGFGLSYVLTGLFSKCPVLKYLV